MKINRRGISGLIAAIVLTAIALQLLYVLTETYRNSVSALNREYIKSLSNIAKLQTDIKVSVSNSTVYLSSSNALRILNAYLIDGSTIKRIELPVREIRPTKAPILNSTLYDAILRGSKALLIFDGGKYLIIRNSTLTQAPASNNTSYNGDVRATTMAISEIFNQQSSVLCFNGSCDLDLIWFAPMLLGYNNVQALRFPNVLFWKIDYTGSKFINETCFNFTGKISVSWFSAAFFGVVVYYSHVRTINVTLTFGYSTPYSAFFSSTGKGVVGQVTYYVFPEGDDPTKPFQLRPVILTNAGIPNIPLYRQVVKVYRVPSTWSHWVVKDKLSFTINLSNAPPEGYVLIGFEANINTQFAYYQNTHVS